MKFKAKEKANEPLVLEQIEKHATSKNTGFLTSAQRENIRKQKLKNLLKETHFLQVTGSANNLLIQLQIHDEHMKAGSTTLGSYTHGNDPALVVSALSDLVRRKIKNLVSQADAIGVQLYESTDISKIQILIIVASLVKNCHSTLVFLDAIELASATSEALLEALDKTVFQEYGVTKT